MKASQQALQRELKRKEKALAEAAALLVLDDLTIADQRWTDLIGEIQSLYLSDRRPWIIGFSGGKDSTTVLSLVYSALLDLPKEQLNKHVYVVSSDKLVETPVVVNMILSVLDTINNQAKSVHLQISAHPVRPKPDQTFWANLLGRGYPAPTLSFRWCTERMKIDPVSAFILDNVAHFGEVIVVLGGCPRTNIQVSRLLYIGLINNYNALYIDFIFKTLSSRTSS